MTASKTWVFKFLPLDHVLTSLWVRTRAPLGVYESLYFLATLRKLARSLITTLHLKQELHNIMTDGLDEQGFLRTSSRSHSSPLEKNENYTI